MSDLAVRFEGVGKDYRYFSLSDVALEIPYGQVMGFIGPNGAGKSTTIKTAVVVLSFALTLDLQSKKTDFI